jgi:hypothetical protein
VEPGRPAIRAMRMAAGLARRISGEDMCGLDIWYTKYKKQLASGQ